MPEDRGSSGIVANNNWPAVAELAACGDICEPVAVLLPENSLIMLIIVISNARMPAPAQSVNYIYARSCVVHVPAKR